MVGDTVVQLPLSWVVGIFISTIGIVLIPLLAFLWKVVESRNRQLHDDLAEIRKDIKDMRSELGEMSNRITRVESRLDALPTEFDKNLMAFENALLKQMLGGSSHD